MEYSCITFILFTFTGNFIVTAGLELPDYDASCLQGSDVMYDHYYIQKSDWCDFAPSRACYCCWQVTKLPQLLMITFPCPGPLSVIIVIITLLCMELHNISVHWSGGIYLGEFRRTGPGRGSHSILIFQSISSQRTWLTKQKVCSDLLPPSLWGGNIAGQSWTDVSLISRQ